VSNFARALAEHGDRSALLTDGAVISYRDLAARVSEVAARLGTRRRLVLLAGANTVDAVVAYLAALASDNPLLLAPGDRPDTIKALIDAYDPDLVLDGERFDERRADSAHTLHPDLALLLTTSGTTGSPKLVRLSSGNLDANAESIATYLELTGADRAATALPMHYCYGLSVINSHLLRGAGLILTDRSVADPRFWDLFRAHRGTSFAGVPYTFELLDRVGFDDMRLPDLRYVTQAGGRLPAERVRHYAALGRRDGWRFFVMYGQTEATARMAYLPPERAERHPTCIGIPVPGGAFRLAPLSDRPEPDTGELVYSGPNVMLGYATTPADLALGRTIDELHTGDVARLAGEGGYEIVGRLGGLVKIAGLRIDPHHVEAMLDRAGVSALCLGVDGALVVAVADHEPRAVRRLAARVSGLPASAVRVCRLGALPRLPSGKPDYPAVAEHARHGQPTGDVDVRALFAEVLDTDEVTDDSTFVSLGGDSLSYVAMSIRLERALGHLPANWHTTPIRDLRPGKVKRGRTLDTTLAVRAVAIVLIVGTHARFWELPGGAHLLLAVAGFNFGRFHLTSASRQERLRKLGRSVRHIAIPSMCWIALAVLLTDSYSVVKILLLNYLLGPRGFNDFWFVETLVYTLLALLIAMSVPAVDRIERRLPFGLPIALATLALVTRYELLPGGRPATPLLAFWLFALGWAAAKATGTRHRIIVTVAAAATVPGFFGHLAREAVILGGITLIVRLPAVRSSQWLNRAAGVLAGSSLYIYLTHWQVLPLLYGSPKILVTLAAIAAGIAYAAGFTLLRRGAVRAGRAVRDRLRRPELPTEPTMTGV
jgi:acyl-CoA synthetase (AMP-forming)/AMP-acid ligase II